MKRKFSKILGVTLTVALLVSLVLAAAPVSGRTLEWSEEVILKSSDDVSSPETITTGSDIISMVTADDGEIIYAVVEDDTSGTGYAMKSDDAGESFGDVTFENGTIDITHIAVTFDDPDYVASAGTVTGVNTVFFSDDAADGWTESDVSAEMTGTITALAISEDNVAVGDDAANLAIVTAEAFAGWVDATAWTNWNDDNTGTLVTTTTIILAVAFSPMYGDDDTILAVTTDGTSTWLQKGNTDDEEWNADTGYPAEIGETIAATVATVSLPDTYLGIEAADCVVYIGTDEGVYRMDDYDSTNLKAGDWPAVAYNSDDNKLLVGRADSGRVDMSENPDAGSPSFTRPATLKMASGSTGVTSVAWCGSTMVAGTNGDESAVSVSEDARSWNGLSLIDTTLSDVNDLAVAEDGSVIYLSSTDGDYVSVWRKASRWERVFCEDVDAAGEVGLIRIAPANPEVIFLARVGSDEIRSSTDSGDNWKRATADVDVTDMAAKDELIVFCMDDGGDVSASLDGGRTFEDAEGSDVDGQRIVVEPVTGDVIVFGLAAEFVAASVSSDDGANWEATPEELGIADDGTNAVFGAADGDYANNGIIYAAQGDVIMRWEVGGDYEDWKEVDTSTTYPIRDVDPDTAGDQQGTIVGLASFGGALYAMYTGDMDADANDDDSAFARTIEGTSRTPYWIASDSVLDAMFDLSPNPLLFSSGSTRIWSVNTTPASPDPDELWSYTDVVEAVVAPELTSPSDGAMASVDALLDKINPVRFAWEEVNEYTYYQLRLGTNDAVTVNFVTYDVPSKYEWTTIADGTGGAAEFEYAFVVGETYYWKVRVNDPVYGPWSEVRSFTIEEPEAAAIAPPAQVTVQPAPAPEVTVEAPAPAPAPQVTVEVPPAEVPPTPGYIWAIIAIGAILVIAVIVLILRTRRPV
jgi:hypothetical protein